MPDGLTLKQQRFAQEYVKRNGNGTQAALAAGYANGNEVVAAVQASENLRKPRVKAAIRKLTLRHEISAERVLKRLDNLSHAAEEAEQYGISAKCEELLGKSLGMWIDRSETLNVNVSGEHLEAIMARAQARRALRGTQVPLDTQSTDESQPGQQDDDELSR